MPTQRERAQVAAFGKKQAAQAAGAAKNVAKSVDISGENGIIKFNRNLRGLNADKPDRLRIVLNEIDAKNISFIMQGDIKFLVQKQSKPKYNFKVI